MNSFVVCIAALLCLVGTAQAASIATDQASNSTYSGGTYNGLNGGTGFGAWTVTADSTGSSAISTSTGNGQKVFQIGETGTTVNTNITTALRPFTGTLTAGQAFSFDSTLNSSGTGALLGFSLENSSGTVLFDAHATGGGNQYVYSDKNSTNATLTGVHYNYTVTDTFALTLLDSAGDYSLTVSSSNTGTNGVTGGSSTVNGTINNASGIAQVLFYDNASGSTNGVQFTNLTATPEPASASILGLAGAGLLARRRRR